MQARGDRLPLELLRLDAVKLDHVVFGLRGHHAVRASHRASRTTYRSRSISTLSASTCTRVGAARVEDPSRRAVSGEGPASPSAQSNDSNGGDDRQREQAAGAQVGVCAAQELDPPARAAEQLHGLHRHQAQVEVAVERSSNVRASAQTMSTSGVPARSRQSVEQLGIEVQRRHAMAGPRRDERHAAGARAHIEDPRGASVDRAAPSASSRHSGRSAR